MTPTGRCPNGHPWPATSTAATHAGTLVVCPVCGLPLSAGQSLPDADETLTLPPVPNPNAVTAALPTAKAPGDPRVASLLARWESLWGSGQDLAAEELCRDCPELLPEVQRGITA